MKRIRSGVSRFTLHASRPDIYLAIDLAPGLDDPAFLLVDLARSECEILHSSPSDLPPVVTGPGGAFLHPWPKRATAEHAETVETVKEY